MDQINKQLSAYQAGETNEEVKNRYTALIRKEDKYDSKKLIPFLFSCMDLTSLNTFDNRATAVSLCEKISDLSKRYNQFGHVAAVCVYPPLVATVKENLPFMDIQLAAVGAGFPSSQTFLSVKLAECELLVSKGATEIDIVMPVGQFLAGAYQVVFDEIALIKHAIGQTHLKVILETGLLQDAEQIRQASLLAMEAGADFIKTSTGKVSPAATPQAVMVMTRAIADYHKKTGKQVGIKPAGGISTLADALPYYRIVETELGNDWLNPGLFRIGASRLANALLSEYYQDEILHF